jgi:hypothetical protein
MGLCNSPDIFQDKMSCLMGDLEYVRAYFDDLLIITKGTYFEHLQKLCYRIDTATASRLKIKHQQIMVCRREISIPSLLDNQNGIQPTQEKGATVLNISAPTKEKELCRFFGMVNYYRDMWIRRSNILAPLSTVTSKAAQWKWSEEHQRSFYLMK